MESCKSDTGKPKDVLDTTKPTTTTVSEAVLSYEQVTRLDGVMQQVVPIHGRGNFPTLEIKLKDLVQVVKTNLANDDVLVKDIRINGGAASYVLAADSAPPYKDVDLIFKVSLDSNRTFDKIKNAVLDSLLNFLPEGVSKTRMSSCSLKEAYVHKMVKVRPTEGDRWSLISLNNNQGKNVELKFVDVMRRQFEFSVDSFQINLDSLFVFYDCSEMPMSLTFYPTIVAESVYGDFEEARARVRSVSVGKWLPAVCYQLIPHFIFTRLTQRSFYTGLLSTRILNSNLFKTKWHKTELPSPDLPLKPRERSRASTMRSRQPRLWSGSSW